MRKLLTQVVSCYFSNARAGTNKDNTRQTQLNYSEDLLAIRIKIIYIKTANNYLKCCIFYI